jgi:hypothetical protein
MGWGMVEGKSSEVQEGKLLGVLEMFLRNNRALGQGGGGRSFNGASTGSSQTGTSIPRVEVCTAPRACDSGGTGVVQAHPGAGGVRCAARTANESSGWQTLLEQVYVHLSILHEWWYLWA